MSGLKYKSVLITGATGGIGQALAKALHQHGSRLILTASSRDKLLNLNAELNDKHYVFSADLASHEERKALITFCQNLLHPPEVVIHLAGINQFSRLTGFSDTDLTALITLNLTSQIALTRDLLPLLMQRDSASIIHVGSILGSIGMPGYSIYCASKFGLRGFCEALNRELLDTHVRVRYFAPRTTETSINGMRVNEMNRALGNRVDQPEVVADALIRFMQNTSNQCFLGWPEKLFVRINSLLPGIVDKVMLKQLAVIKRYL